ncbi:hypothetical protein PFICI_03198 [Pestalotiopsis fici W106-1]|uniref:Uncharacterized protein n=1 Tax=Pestalotiopsis fici (strain W106-1 / CGMCC3.15140) TaxID=1229662 RepID=W3XGF2_PESFW|nr:uncharacterized protein PFICI_03198 [Pestalotiopsis fici W106-1]ETS85173.1 hypothetical protein PFICI_03198 [Pestalotiopsis fici W106-1]
MGRRPVAPKLPYGATSVMVLVKNDQNVEVNTAGGSSLTAHHGAVPSAKALARSPRGRLSRSGQRPPCPNAPDVSDFTAWSNCYSPPNFRVLQAPLRTTVQVNCMLESTEVFFAVHRPFMLGRSFLPEFHSVVRRLFARSPQVLADAYTVAMSLLSSRHATFRGLDEHDLAIGIHCLERLMGSPSCISRAEDAAVILLLGQAMHVYNELIPTPDSQIITRGTLLSVQRWFPSLLERPDLDVVTLTPVLTDTVECLIRREIPVIRVPTATRCIVDRFAGLSSSLLPLLYELCERSYEAKLNGTEPSLVDAERIPYPDKDPYHDIECKISRWQPQLPPHFFTKYSSFEVSVILAQAQCYRLAALLVIHRLRFPLGVEDAAAQVYAGEILHELSLLKSWPADAATGLALDFPLLVATLEQPEPGIEIYKAFEPFRFRRQHSLELLDFIHFVTTQRQSGFKGLWFDLARNQLLGVTLT